MHEVQKKRTPEERSMISVVLPMFNEEEAAPEVVRRVAAEFEDVGLDVEMVAVDDGSTDRTRAVLGELADRDARVVPVFLSRNFGKEAAMAAGIEAARGEAVLLMDSDLQHPPSLIPQMIQCWLDGYDVVDAVKRSRGRESLLYKASATVFYTMMGEEVGPEFRKASDFKLLDRQAVDALLSLPERSRFLRGLVAWVGFDRTTVEFDVEERHSGETRWNLRALIAYAMGNVVSFSVSPLLLTAWVGVLTTLVGVLLGAHTLYNYLSDNAVSGFTTVILLQVFFAGVTLLAIGVVSVYLAKVLEEVKARPAYLVRRERPSGAGGLAEGKVAGSVRVRMGIEAERTA